MKIMVFDVPAEKGGALSILNSFYKEVLEYDDKNIEWTFVVSTPYLNEKENINVLRFPWVKKSWMHRFVFDLIVAPYLVKRYKITKVFSLQNIIIPFSKCEQILYVHQPLPFVDYRFSFKENKLYWVYQNLIGNKIIKSIKKARKVIVQTEWMKKSAIIKAKVKEEKVIVVPPLINIEINEFFTPTDKSLSTFFYPASGMDYKNHQLIIEASKHLKRNNENDYKIIFTLNGNESEHVKNLLRQVKEEKLPIFLEGFKSREEVFSLYNKSILLFPSYIETFGLPLLEVKHHKGIIFASDTAFSNEILSDYNNVYFFDSSDHIKLFNLMLQAIKQEIPYNPNMVNSNYRNKQNLISIIIQN